MKILGPLRIAFQEDHLIIQVTFIFKASQNYAFYWNNCSLDVGCHARRVALRCNLPSSIV